MSGGRAQHHKVLAKYANSGSLSMCQIDPVAFGINQCHHDDVLVQELG